MVRMTTETLTGIPSIIYGLLECFCLLSFEVGYSIMAGSATIAIMILPTIMRTTEEALLSVSDSLRKEALGLELENCALF